MVVVVTEGLRERVILVTLFTHDRGYFWEGQKIPRYKLR